MTWHRSSVPRYERVPGRYDLGRIKAYDMGTDGDRYTVVFVDLDRDILPPRKYHCFATSYGMGISGWGEYPAGPHLGKRIPYSSLPLAVRRYCETA